MTDLIESHLHAICEECNKKINIDKKIACVFYNVYDPPTILHTKCFKQSVCTANGNIPSKKPFSVKKCKWDQRPERYIDLTDPEKKNAVQITWNTLISTTYRSQNPRAAWRMLRRRSRRRRF